MDTLNKISELLKERKISQSELCSFLGIKKNAYTNWKSGHTSSYKKYLPQIADYLNCSVDYLLGREESSNDSSTPDPYDLFGQVMPGKARMIPVFETVSAGFGRQANDVVIDYIPLIIENDYEAEHTICIRVSGNSMYPKIADGNLIQVYKTDSIDSGRVGVFLIDETDGIVKRVFYNPGEDWLELHSFNPEYPPRRFEGPDLLRVRTLGLVKRIIKDI